MAVAVKILHWRDSRGQQYFRTPTVRRSGLNKARNRGHVGALGFVREPHTFTLVLAASMDLGRERGGSDVLDFLKLVRSCRFETVRDHIGSFGNSDIVASDRPTFEGENIF